MVIYDKWTSGAIEVNSGTKGVISYHLHCCGVGKFVVSLGIIMVKEEI